MLRRCPRCNLDLPITSFHKKTKGGFQSYCKECTKKTLPKDRSAKWRARHPERHCAEQAKRRSRKLQSCPPWADLDAIKDVYLEAKYFGYHVDHIIPLKGKNVCGLHVWDNLQLLSPKENLRKGNRYV